MPDTVSKTDNFLKAIEKYAEEQRGKLRTEAEEFQERELNNAERQRIIKLKSGQVAEIIH